MHHRHAAQGPGGQPPDFFPPKAVLGDVRHQPGGVGRHGGHRPGQGQHPLPGQLQNGGDVVPGVAKALHGGITLAVADQNVHGAVLQGLQGHLAGRLVHPQSLPVAAAGAEHGAHKLGADMGLFAQGQHPPHALGGGARRRGVAQVEPPPFGEPLHPAGVLGVLGVAHKQ